MKHFVNSYQICQIYFQRAWGDREELVSEPKNLWLKQLQQYLLFFESSVPE